MTSWDNLIVSFVRRPSVDPSVLFVTVDATTIQLIQQPMKSPDDRVFVIKLEALGFGQNENEV